MMLSKIRTFLSEFTNIGPASWVGQGKTRARARARARARKRQGAPAEEGQGKQLATC